MDDREAVAAIAAGDPAGIATAYDRHAAALYGYCQWMLDRPADAADALRDTFVIASAAIGDLADAAKLRPWLYSVARHECQRRLGATVPAHGGQADADEQPAGADEQPADVGDQSASADDLPASAGDQPASAADPAHRPADAADQDAAPSGGQAGADELPDIRGDLEPAELLSLIRGILAELPPREREVIELSLRHNLHDDDLAEVLGVSRNRARSLTERARGRVEKALGALLVARGREYCPELGTLLADWDGRLTEQARDLIAEHVEYCAACADRRRGALRPAALSGLLPLATLPPELREQVLEACSAAPPDAAAYRKRGARSAEPTWRSRVWQAITPTRWPGFRANPGRSTAVAMVVIWVVAAVSVTLVTFSGSDPPGVLAARSTTSPPSASPSASPSPAAVTTTAPAPATVSRSASAKPSPRVTQRQIYVPPPVQSAPTSAQPSPSRSAKPSPSRSPEPSRSPSPKPSKSPSPSASASASPSPTSTP
jgi:RNA polymerase sigma factor (sigma-70 family)